MSRIQPTTGPKPIEIIPLVTNCSPVAAGNLDIGTCDGITSAMNIVLNALPNPINTPTAIIILNDVTCARTKNYFLFRINIYYIEKKNREGDIKRERENNV